MKKIALFFLAAGTIALVSCGGKKEEENKMVPMKSIVGTHSNLLAVNESVKVMLVNTEGDVWEVRASIPLSNTTPWSQAPGTNPKDREHYLPKMTGLDIVYFDKNDNELEYDLYVPSGEVATLLGSDETKTISILTKQAWANLYHYTYKKAKEIYDKVASIGLKNAELYLEKPDDDSKSSSSSSSSSISDDLDDVLDEYNKAVDASKKAIDAAGKVNGKSVKAAKKALDAYEDALDAYGSLLD